MLENTTTFKCVCKLRWTPKAASDPMTIRNYEAIRLMSQAIMQEEAGNFQGAMALAAQAEDVLQRELREYTAGQQVVVPVVPSLDFAGLGGVL